MYVLKQILFCCFQDKELHVFEMCQARNPNAMLDYELILLRSGVVLQYPPMQKVIIIIGMKIYR